MRPFLITQVFLSAALMLLPFSAEAGDRTNAGNTRDPAPVADTTTSDLASLPWQTYPSVGQIGTEATVSLKGDLYFLGERGTSDFLVMNGNPARDDNYTLAPQSLNWFAVFSFDPSGYVKDDEQIDAGQLLSTLRDQNKVDLSERKTQGLPLLTLDGWAVEPHYDKATNLLEWGTKLHTPDGQEVVNYTVRLLGRSGVMSAILVSDPANLDADVQSFHSALGGFEFSPGQTYAEYRPGDKMAEYGLAALIIGGAAAAAAKSGLIKPLVAAIVAGGAALFAGVGALFRRLFKRSAKG